MGVAIVAVVRRSLVGVDGNIGMRVYGPKLDNWGLTPLHVD